MHIRGPIRFRLVVSSEGERRNSYTLRTFAIRDIGTKPGKGSRPTPSREKGPSPIKKISLKKRGAKYLEKDNTSWRDGGGKSRTAITEKSSLRKGRRKGGKIKPPVPCTKEKRGTISADASSRKGTKDMLRRLGESIMPAPGED